MGEGINGRCYVPMSSDLAPPANEMYFEGLPSWPAGALSRFETALNLASCDAAKS
jgi:hypothetical protein